MDTLSNIERRRNSQVFDPLEVLLVDLADEQVRNHMAVQAREAELVPAVEDLRALGLHCATCAEEGGIQSAPLELIEKPLLVVLTQPVGMV